MIPFPDRIGKLIQRIEAGEVVTQKDVDRIARLQALDIARAGEEFARQASSADRQTSESLESVV